MVNELVALDAGAIALSVHITIVYLTTWPLIKASAKCYFCVI